MRPMTIAPKMLLQLAERAKRIDGCVNIPGSDIYEFPQGSNVAVIIGLDYPAGHIVKDKRRADELREQIEARGIGG